MLLPFLALYLLNPQGSAAALPACPSGTTSPPGGLWSEWVISGSPTCSTSCGSCSKLFYTRTCLSQRASVPCSGPTTKLTLCNTQTCVYPAQRTCCIPYLPMLINGTMQCGPFPKEDSSSTSPCCPGNGIWTQWTSFARNEDTKKYFKTRECSSTEAGCNCVGEDYQEQDACPCPTSLIAAKGCDEGVGNGLVARLHRILVITDATCTATLKMEASNDHWEGTKNIKYCTPQLDLNFVPLIRFLLADGTTCRNDRSFDCRARDTTIVNGTLPVSFTCDLETQNWRYDYAGYLVSGYVQMSWD